jgi:hypothetical protein
VSADQVPGDKNLADELLWSTEMLAVVQSISLLVCNYAEETIAVDLVSADERVAVNLSFEAARQLAASLTWAIDGEGAEGMTP